LAVLFVGFLIAAQLWETKPKEPRNSLRWGADATGGAPYVYRKHGQQTGFEADLARYLARQLDLEPWFVQGTWEKLTKVLDRSDIDVVLNGYEWSPDREKQWLSTVPYYRYSLNLIVRKENDSIVTWEDLRRSRGGKPYRVGVLANTAAHRYLKTAFGDDIEIEAFSEGVTSALRLVKDRSLDATVQDHPAAVYYVVQDSHEVGFRSDLRIVEPERIVAPGYYVMYVRPKDGRELRDKLNQALRNAIQSGELKRIYSRYGIWTDDQQTSLMEAAANWPPSSEADPDDAESESASDSDHWWDYALLLLRAAVTTVLLSCISMPMAIAIGLLVAVGRLYVANPLVTKPLGAYVEFLRGTPLLMQLFFIYFILPGWGIRLDPFWAGVLGLSINYSAYEAENYRAGLLAVPHGQMEAALSLGMTRWVALRRIIIPQAVRIVIPPVTNDFIALFKDTSVCSVIAVTELTGKYNEISNDDPSVVLQVGIMTAALYLLMSYPLSLLARRLEKKYPRVVT
jgi:polar amino acid transport system substrate-binding protein